MGITFGELVPHQGGIRFSISTPLLILCGNENLPTGRQVSSDPEPCQGLDKAVIKLTEYGAVEKVFLTAKHTELSQRTQS
jgi:hypothetical protein